MIGNAAALIARCGIATITLRWSHQMKGRRFVHISLTPFWNGVGGSFNGAGANFGQIGLGFTWH